MGTFFELLAQRLVVFLPDERDLVDQVDEPSVLVLAADGIWIGTGWAPSRLLIISML